MSIPPGAAALQSVQGRLGLWLSYRPLSVIPEGNLRLQSLPQQANHH
jgi:hypothetical protein